jgi:dipeptidyl-peptidase-4
MKKISSLLLLSFLCHPVLFAQLNLEAIWKTGTYSAKSAGGLQWSNDGKCYAELIYNDAGKPNIVLYSVETAKIIDTLMRPNDFVPKDSIKGIKPMSFSISDDGKRILIATEMEAIYRHSTIEKNYIYFKDSKKLEPLSAKGKQRYAQFSPDGLKVAYIIENNMYYVDLLADEITEVQITKSGKKNEIIYGATDWVYEEEFGINRGFYWSPDSKRIAYYRFDVKAVKEFSLTMYKNNTYPVEEKYKYPKAGEDNSIVTVDVYGLENRDVIYSYSPSENPQAYYLPRVKWTNEPTVLCIEKLNRLQNHLDLLLVDVNTRILTTVLTETSDKYVDVDAKGDCPIFLNDKKQFIWLSEKSGLMQAYFEPVYKDGTAEKQFTFFTAQLTAFYGYKESTQTAYFQICKQPYEKQIVQVKNSVVTDLWFWNERSTTGNYSANFNEHLSYGLITYSNFNTPPVTQLCSFIDSVRVLRMLEDNAALKAKLAALHLAPTSFFSFKTADSTELFGYVIKPLFLKKKKKYPVFMTCYGGPGNSQVEDRWGGANYLYYQYLASLGYAVVCVDNRGTGNRGLAFKQCTYLNLGVKETADQIEAAKYLGTWNWVDKNRISMFGWSYGGFMATNCILKGADVFKCAIAVAPVTDWRFYDNIYTERYMQTPATNKAGYVNTSCLNIVDAYKGKLLLMHGTGDDNVHLQNSIELSNALINKNKQFDMLFFPNKNHGIGGGYSRLVLFTKMTDFLLKNL